MADETRIVAEVRREGRPGLVHPEWGERWPWLVQGITTSDPSGAGDLALFGREPAGEVTARWEALLAALPVTGAVHARQVHGNTVRVHAGAAPGLLLTPPADAHLTRSPGLLLAVTVADCTPAFLVAPEHRAVAVVHAGWRGAAAGILERAVHTFRERLGVRPGELHIHLGPGICGACYEVGPEVHEALGEPVPAAPTPVDLGANLARRARGAGVPGGRITRSPLCTLCGQAPLFSHRGGHTGRQVGYLAVAP